MDAGGSLKDAFVSLSAPLSFPVVVILTQSVVPTTLASLVFLSHPVRAVPLVLGTLETLCRASLPPFGWHLLADDSSCQLETDWFIQLLSAEAAPLESFRFF